MPAHTSVPVSFGGDTFKSVSGGNVGGRQNHNSITDSGRPSIRSGHSGHRASDASDEEDFSDSVDEPERVVHHHHSSSTVRYAETTLDVALKQVQNKVSSMNSEQIAQSERHLFALKQRIANDKRTWHDLHKLVELRKKAIRRGH